ncbi:nadE [Wigglesworthia glossinidia endosymbiont of Glossina brevipalpis]|uniref:NH(3)-dependent NAD(+) synthetase n=1 Tax=Wigglesworthia glossinidia brevipalpis TaxID=36870 RepID=Q8D2L2_WIGBR|nr:nadE [Wigglesworthia glossinidia endosymbiont of Glossina brevipalpis]
MNTQKKIIKEFNVQPNFEEKHEFERIKNFFISYLNKFSYLRTLVLGVSGGQDSTLTGKICYEVIKEMKKKNNNLNYKFIALRLPYGKQMDEIDCKLAIKFINPDKVIKINIKSAVKASVFSLKKSGINITDHIKGNEKSRERMKVQYSVAGMTSGIVVGTCNAAESITGFFTKHGDSAVDLNPILHLNKRQVKKILIYLKCPKRLYSKIPTADLEDDRPGYPDEKSLGIKYDVIDDYLEGKIINLKMKNIIENLFEKTKHKRINQALINFFNKY